MGIPSLNRTLFVVAALLLLTVEADGRPVDPPVPVETMYADAVGKENAVRAALEAEPPAEVVLKAARTVVSDFEAIVRAYPSSGYSDDALWRAGLVSLEAFNKLGDPRDKDAGLRLLRRLAAQYPTSRLAKHVPEIVATMGGSEPPPVTAAEPAKLSTIKDIRRTVLPDVVRVTIELDSEVPFHEERLDNPTRVFVDLSSTRAAPSLVDQTLLFEGDADLVRQIRIGRHPNNTTRVVLDAAGMSSYSVYPLYEPYRLVIDCARSAPPRAAAVTLARAAAPRTVAPPVLQARPLRIDWTGTVQSLSPFAADTIRIAFDDPIPPPSDAPARTIAPDKNLAGGFSIARQLGLKVSRIVIDPGHGGHDPGAMGKGLTEAELVLDVALRLEKLLLKAPGVEVILTRRTDEYLALQERTAIANREGADLFLSIHANANSSAQARGVETYFLNFASNLSAAAVAARENAASGQAMSSLPDLLKTIALNNKLDESRDLATDVQRAMIEKLRVPNKTVKDLGVKQAPFMVLIGAAMPSVLAEISFMTNASEAKLLRQTTYRQRIAEALFDALRTYQSSLKSVTTTALER